jgi:hypothetical protein
MFSSLTNWQRCQSLSPQSVRLRCVCVRVRLGEDDRRLVVFTRVMIERETKREKIFFFFIFSFFVCLFVFLFQGCETQICSSIAIDGKCGATRATPSPFVCVSGEVTEIDLRDLALDGSIATQIGDLTSLASLVLYSNELVGTLPSEIGKLERLLVIDVFDNFLSGTIPTQIGLLQKLTNL